jgi:hypothetical protein
MRNPQCAAVSLFQAVSNVAETANNIILKGNLLPVSLFHDFRGRAREILIWPRWVPARSATPSEVWDRRLSGRFWFLNHPPRQVPGVARIKGNIKSKQWGLALRLHSKLSLRWPNPIEKINARPSPENRETAKRGAVFEAKSGGCRFHQPLKPLETVKQPNQTPKVLTLLGGNLHA